MLVLNGWMALERMEKSQFPVNIVRRRHGPELKKEVPKNCTEMHPGSVFVVGLFLSVAFEFVATRDDPEDVQSGLELPLSRPPVGAETTLATRNGNLKKFSSSSSSPFLQLFFLVHRLVDRDELIMS
jgi:hypothetical protein